MKSLLCYVALLAKETAMRNTVLVCTVLLVSSCNGTTTDEILLFRAKRSVALARQDGNTSVRVDLVSR